MEVVLDKEKELIDRMRKAFCGINSEIANISKKNGCNFRLLCFLQAVDSGEPKSQKQICDEWVITKTTLNTLAKQCEKLGYITFKPINGAKREKLILLTSDGKKFKDDIFNKIYPIEKNALLKMSDYEKFINDMELFNTNLKELSNNLFIG